MALPFLKKRNQAAGISIQMKAPDNPDMEPERGPDPEIEACAEELIRAIHARDAKGASEAIKAAFAILESRPHEEAGE